MTFFLGQMGKKGRTIPYCDQVRDDGVKVHQLDQMQINLALR